MATYHRRRTADEVFWDNFWEDYDDLRAFGFGPIVSFFGARRLGGRSLLTGRSLRASRPAA